MGLSERSAAPGAFLGTLNYSFEVGYYGMYTGCCGLITPRRDGKSEQWFGYSTKMGCRMHSVLRARNSLSQHRAGDLRLDLGLCLMFRFVERKADNVYSQKFSLGERYWLAALNLDVARQDQTLAAHRYLVRQQHK